MKKDAIIAALAFSGLKPVPTVDAQVVQSTGTSAAAVMSQKATTDALNQKQNAADPAGLADNLTPYSADSGAEQSVPFINQGTGCGNGESVVDTGSFCQLKKKLGNTVGVNQYVDNANRSFTGASTGQQTKQLASFTIVSGHIYLATCMQKTTYTSIERNTFYVVSSDSSFASIYESGHESYNMQAGARLWMFTANVSGPAELRFWTVNANVAGEYENVAFHDVTQWFGSPDRIPAHLLSHHEDWGRYYSGSLAYNPGQLVNADGSVLTSIGRNVWDEEWEEGAYNPDGSKTTQSDRIRSKNPIPVIPNTAYYLKVPSISSIVFVVYLDNNGDGIETSIRTYAPNTVITTPANAAYMVFYLAAAYGTTYNHDITISLYYSDESGYDQYYPYSVLAEVDTGSEVLYAYDEKTPDGTIYRNSTRLDLGSLTYIDPDANGRTRCNEAVAVSLPASAYNQIPSVISSKFIAITPDEWYDSSKEGITITCAGYGVQERLGITSPSFIGKTAAEIKTLLSGVYAEFQNNTPTTEQGTAFPENIPCDDFGSLMWTQTKGIPQGNEIFYPVDYKASIDTLYNRVEGDMSRIVIDDDLADYNTKAEDESKFATKDACGGTLRQLLAVSETIDFDNTAYIDLGDCTYNTNQTGTNTYEAATSFSVPKANGTDNFLCSSIATKAYADDGKYGIRGYGSSGAVAIRVPISVASTPEGIKAALKGVLLAYEKASS